MTVVPDHRPIKGLILAGKRAVGPDPLDGLGVPHKGLIEIAGQPIIERVLSAVNESARLDQLSIATSPALLSEFSYLTATHPELQFEDVAPSPSRTIAKALKHLSPDRDLLVTTSDHALLTSGMIREFLDRIDRRSHAAAAACVERDTYLARFPDTPRTFIRFSDFAFSGANVFWFRGTDAMPLIRFWRDLEDKRKHPLKMAHQIGLMTGLLYLCGRLGRQAALSHIERKTGVAVALIPLSDARAAIDVDKPADIEAVTDILGAERRT